MRIAALVACLVAASSGATACAPWDEGEPHLRAFLLAHLRPVRARTRVTLASVALHDHGEPNLLIYVTGPQWCGSGGCALLVLAHRGAGYRLVSKTPITRPPIRVLATSAHGWRDLGVLVGGGGAERPYEASLRFDGRRYLNPTAAPALHSKVAPGYIAIPADDKGDLLSPDAGDVGGCR